MKHFERDTVANKLFLKKHYFHTEKKEGTSVEAHLKHMKGIADKSAAIGAPFSEEDQIVTLLDSLPRSYSTLVTALEARGDDITLKFVQQSLIHKEQKISGDPSDDILPGGQKATALVGVRWKTKSQKPAGSHLSQIGRWLVDSGASGHMTYEKELLTDYKKFEKLEKVGLGDGRTVDAVGIGNVEIMLFRLSDPRKCVIHDVLFVLNLTCNLFQLVQ